MEIFKPLLKISFWILLILSTLALVFIHVGLAGLEFDFTPSGFNFYIKELSKYGYLFGATISVLALIYGSSRYHEKIKNDRFIEWKSAIEPYLNYAGVSNEMLKVEFTRKRYELFRILYNLGFRIQKKVELEKCLFLFKNEIELFESQNKNYQNTGGAYPDLEYVFIFDSINYLIHGSCIECYPGYERDLKICFP
ncbi:MAG: hypothetical protein R2879_00720 [Saprospiraceae bacterium]